MDDDPSRGVSSKRLSVPRELIPYLHRIHTQDYVSYVDNQKHNESDKGTVRFWASKILRIPGFEYFMGVVIVTNFIVMIIETDNAALEDHEFSTTVDLAAEIFGWVVLALFVLELGMRLLVLRCLFWKDAWNMFDFIVVTIDSLVSLAGLLGNHMFPVSILRVFRLAKLARVFKVLRVFPELRLLLTGLISSISAIFWGTLLLLFSMLVWSLVAVLYIHPLNQQIHYDNCERCSRAYSSVMHSTLTFWQQIVTGDSWGQVTIPLIEKHPSTVMFFIPVFLSVGMAVTNLILGVVVNVAQQAQDALQEEDNADKALFKLEQHTHLLDLCRQMDTDNTGYLTQGQVYAAFEKEGEFRETILALDITKEEFDIVWAIIDPDNRGSISYKELVSHLSTMKISDTQFMLAYIKYYIIKLRNSVLGQMENQHAEAMRVELEVQKDIVQLEENEETLLEDDARLLQKADRVIDAVETSCGARSKGSSSEATHRSHDWVALQLDFLQANGTSKKSTTTEKVSANRLETPSCKQARINARHCGEAKPFSVKEVLTEMQSWLDQIRHEFTTSITFLIRHDITTLGAELKGMLLDINAKVDLQDACPATHLDVRNSDTESASLVPPERGFTCCVPTAARLRHGLGPQALPGFGMLS